MTEIDGIQPFSIINIRNYRIEGSLFYENTDKGARKWL